MKDLQALFEEGLRIVESCGIEHYPISKCTVNRRAKMRWGCCKIRYGTYSIEVSDRILEDSVPDNATMSVIVHEILHATNSYGHDWRWQRYARMVMAQYPELDIRQADAPEKFGYKSEDEILRAKYILRCTKCGHEWGHHRMSNVVKYPSLYHHQRCGGALERVK